MCPALSNEECPNIPPMSSPASSTTSTKAATLSHPKRKACHSSSFPAIATLRNFRKKALPQPSSSREPFEVAPGILNTDATAKVFGYVDTDDEPADPRRRSVRSKTQDLIEPSPSKVVSTGKERRGKRMVSSEDRLTERGANPRTGLVSPFVTSESELGHDHDYMSVGKAGSPRPFAKARTRSGKWKQDGLGWSLVESPLLSPIAQSTNAPPTRQVSLKELEDKLLVEMPGVDNPEPENPTDLQVRKYQEQMARIRKKEGSDAIVDPDTLPSPRQWTPEGPSSPPNRLHKILKRKKVGSGRHVRKISTETVAGDEQKRASSMPTPRKDIKEQRRGRIVIPSNTSKDLSLETRVKFRDPFLDRRPDKLPAQTQSAAQALYTQTRPQEAAYWLPPRTMSPAQSQYPQTRPQEAAHRQSPPQRPNPSKEGYLVPPVIPILSQCLPQIHLQHPSDFANLESPSSRRLNQLLPARLRSLHEQKRLVEDACTNISTFITTSARKPDKHQRPNIKRQEGRIVDPRTDQRPQASKMSKENCQQLPGDLLNQRQPSSTSFRVRSQDLIAVLPQEQPLVTNMKSKSPLPMTEAPQGQDAESVCEVAGKCKDSMKRLQDSGAESAAKTAWFQKTTRRSQGPRVGSTNIVTGPIREGRRNGAGTIHMFDHPGKEPADFTVRSDGSTWFAGHWTETDRHDVTSDSLTAMKDRPLALKRSVGEKMANVKLWMDAVEDQLRVSTKVARIQGLLYRVVYHVFRIFHSFSPALKILMASDAEAHDYLMALKDAFQAGCYLLLLMYVFFIVCKVIVLAANIMYWVWHPVKLVLVLLRWCIMS